VLHVVDDDDVSNNILGQVDTAVDVIVDTSDVTAVGVSATVVAVIFTVSSCTTVAVIDVDSAKIIVIPLFPISNLENSLVLVISLDLSLYRYKL